MTAAAARQRAPLRETGERVYVCLVNWNGWRDTIECLESLFASRSPPFRVIVCDNGSADDSIERIRAWAAGTLHADPASPLAPPRTPCAKPIPMDEIDAGATSLPSSDPPLTLVRIGRNTGYAGANNAGLRLALSREDCRYVWLLNNDTVIDADAMTELVAYCQAHPEVGLCGSTLLYYSEPDMVQARGGATLSRWFGITRHIGDGDRWDASSAPDAPILPDYIVGASMLATRAFAEQVGLLSEEYFLYYEELDWAMRGRSRFRLGYARRSIVYHKEGRSIGSSSDARERSALSDYYGGRNRIIFMSRFFPWSLPTVYGGMIVSILKRIKRGQPDRARTLFRIMLAPRSFNPHIEDPQLRMYRSADKAGP